MKLMIFIVTHCIAILAGCFGAVAFLHSHRIQPDLPSVGNAQVSPVGVQSEAGTETPRKSRPESDAADLTRLVSARDSAGFVAAARAERARYRSERINYRLGIIFEATRFASDGNRIAGGALVEELARIEDEISAEEFRDEMIVEMQFANLAAYAGKLDLARERWQRCLDMYGNAPSPARQLLRDDLRRTYTQAASAMVALLPTSDLRSVEFWEFCSDQVKSAAPEKADKLRFTIPGITKTFDTAIVVLQSCRERSQDTDKQKALDAAASVVQEQRRQWIEN
jgi:hypothetical protein